MTAQLQDHLRRAAEAGPPPRIDAAAIVRGGRHRQRRGRVAISGAVAVVAASAIAAVALPGVDQGSQPDTVLPGGSGRSIVVNGETVPAVIQHAPVHEGENLLIEGRHILVRLPTAEPGQPGDGPLVISAESSGPIVYGFVGMRPTHGALSDRDAEVPMNTASYGSMTFYWGVLPSTSDYQSSVPLLVLADPTTGAVRRTSSLCLPYDGKCDWSTVAPSVSPTPS